MKVWLLTTGDGSDGSEWGVEDIYSTFKLAETAKNKYEQPRYRADGHSYIFYAQVEEWDVECKEER